MNRPTDDHPEDLLAEYIDGTLAPDRRDAVESHLAGCDRCRAEADLAEDARGALSRLPERSPPEELAFAVRRRARGGASSSLVRGVGIAAAAAVLIGGGILIGSRLDFDGTAGSGEEAPAEAGRERASQGDAGAPEAQDAAAPSAALDAAPAPVYTESSRDYAQADLVDVARRVRGRARAALDAGLAPTATGYFRSFDPATFGPEIRAAVVCVLHDIPPEQLVVPFSIEAASFGGRAAYVAAFLQGPTPDDPYDRVVIWVADRETCSFEALATQQL